MLQPSKFRLSAYNGTKILVKCCCSLHIMNGITSLPVLFHVVDNDSPSMLGLKTSKKLDLIRCIMKINSFVPITYNNTLVVLVLIIIIIIIIIIIVVVVVVDREVSPVIDPPRHVPASLKTKLDKN